MDQIIEQILSNFSKVKRIIHKITAIELTKLSEPCYYPEMKKSYYELLHACNLVENDVRPLPAIFWKGMKESTWLIHKDPITLFIVLLLHASLIKKDLQCYNSLFTYLTLRYYSNLMHKQIKFCNPDIFKYTVERVSKTHLFFRENSITGGIYFLSGVLQKKYGKDILEMNKERISKMITETRHRISQSVKSFAETYYRSHEEGLSIKTYDETSYDEGEEKVERLSEKNIKFVDDLVKQITVYHGIDHLALEEARRLTRIKSELAEKIIKGLCKIKYADSIKTILTLYIKKTVTGMDDICGNKFYLNVKSLMSLKRTNDQIYFKQQVSLLLNNVLEDISYKKVFDKLSLYYKVLITAFLAYYITLSFRHYVC